MFTLGYSIYILGCAHLTTPWIEVLPMSWTFCTNLRTADAVDASFRAEILFNKRTVWATQLPLRKEIFHIYQRCWSVNQFIPFRGDMIRTVCKHLKRRRAVNVKKNLWFKKKPPDGPACKTTRSFSIISLFMPHERKEQKKKIVTKQTCS